jgi:hypothetical protein
MQGDQKGFVDAFARASVGTGIEAGGYAAGQAGIATGQKYSNQNLDSADREQGGQPYAVNVGDGSYTYDWALPMSPSFSSGVNLADFMGNPKRGLREGVDLTKDVLDAGINASNTIVDQPVLQGAHIALGGRDTEGNQSTLRGLYQLGLSAPASFAPTALSQVNQALDNNPKDTWDLT